MADLNDVLSACADLEEKLSETLDPCQRKSEIIKHLHLVNKKLTFLVPDFEEGLKWMNVSTPLSFRGNLKGKLVVLDFFTYCCINCMHVLPDLEALELAHSPEDGVAIVGVHSAKFFNEKVTANVLSAILRYDIKHPVVNDDTARMWGLLMISCWPTFVLVGPSGQVLYTYVGEGHRQKLLEFVDIALEFFKEDGAIQDHSLPVRLEKENLPPSVLCFPGKVCASEDGKTLVVSDSGHHRVLVLGQDGIIQDIIGGPERGFVDGSYQNCRFHGPQGVCLKGEFLYVADTDNHAIRKVDLRRRQVTTVVGTGNQGQDKEGGCVGTEQAISSPWDLALGPVWGESSKTVLYIAMAGTHQIWAFFLEEAKLHGQRKFPAGTCMRFAGSGSEENRNNSYPEKAGFAQPSGLAVWARAGQECLFVADSESSTIRIISLTDGSVKGLVGGEKDPLNLFAYGDQDGDGVNAKLQHPLGLSVFSQEKGNILVADSYNHKIKMVSVQSKTCQTVDVSGLNEPGGIYVDERNKLAYIADTNNHAIKMLDLIRNTLTNLAVLYPECVISVNDGADGEDSLDVEQSKSVEPSLVMVPPGARLTVLLQLQCSQDVHLTEDAPSSWKLYCEDQTIQVQLQSAGIVCQGNVTEDREQALTAIPSMSLLPSETPVTLCLLFKLFICDTNGTCRMEKREAKRSVIVQEALPTKERSVIVQEALPTKDVTLTFQLTLT